MSASSPGPAPALRGGASLTFHVSHVRVAVTSELPEVVEVLSAIWGCCTRPLLPPTQDARFEVRCLDGGYSVVDALGNATAVARREDVLPMLEAALYRLLPAWHAQQVLLHAACVRLGTATALLLGRSGAGKSSLALTALRAGFEYFSDELSATDGARVWGVPRAVQFEPLAKGASPAPWAADADVTRYRLRLAGDHSGVLPLWFPSPARVPFAPSAAGETHVFAIARGDRDALGPLTPLAALAELHEAAFQPPVLDLGRLVRADHCGELTWRDPQRAIELLAAALSRPAPRRGG